MPADPERATAIENSVVRTLRYAVEELAQSPDRTASKLSQATTQLDSSDAKEHLTPETIAKYRAQIADLQKQVEDAEHAETAARIERDVRRYIRNLEDEIASNGSQVESYLDRAATRLAKDDAVQSLAPDMLANLQREVEVLRAKVTGAPAPAAPTPRAESMSQPPAAASVPAAAPPRESAPPAAPPPAAPSAAPPAGSPATLSEDGQRVSSNIDRLLRLAAGDIDSSGWRQIEGKLEQAAQQLQSSDARSLLPAATHASLSARLGELQEKFAANDRAEEIESLENMLRRLLSDAEQHVDWADRIGGMLAKVGDALETEKAKTYLPSDRVAFWRGEISRVGTLSGGNLRQRAIDEATRPLEELEGRISDSTFEGLDEYSTQRLWTDLETLRTRVANALASLAGDDTAARDLRQRLDAVVQRQNDVYAATKHAATMSRVTAAWDETLAKIAGWENETQDTSAAALGESFMELTQRAVKTLRETLSGSTLFSPIPAARAEYAEDPVLTRIVADGERMIESGLAKMAKAFDAIMDAAKEIPIPAGEFDLRKAAFMAERAREAFGGTGYESERVERAQALLEHWESTIALAQSLTDAYYAKLADEAAQAWPSISSTIAAEDGFNPNEAKWRGKTVRIDGLYNRMRWDFTGNYHLATWVNDTPVAGDFDARVLEAFNSAVKNTRSSIDDHTRWDAIVVVEGEGKLKQRFKTKVKKDGETIGEIEEWRPVDCVTCKVIALRAGPVAVGPQ